MKVAKIYSLLGNLYGQEMVSQNIGVIYSSVGKDSKAISIYKDYLSINQMTILKQTHKT